MKKKNKIIFIIISVIMLLLIVAVGPMDLFTHGYYSEEIDVSQIAEDDFSGEIDLSEQDYSMQFSPQKAHMAGIELYLKNQPAGNTGSIVIEVSDSDGKKVDKITVDLNKVTEASWYKVYTTASLKEGQVYTLNISAINCDTVPHLQLVNQDYLSDEITQGNALVTFAYAQSTFTFQNKIIMLLFVISLWVFLFYKLLEQKNRNVFKSISFIVFVTAILSWNYMYNSMDNQNGSFGYFQSDSEALVTNVIYAEQDGEYFRQDNERGFGLGWYVTLSNYMTDDNWLNGFSRTENSLLLNTNDYTKEVAVVGNQVQFKNGEIQQITAVSDDGSHIYVGLSGDKTSSAKNGSLDDAVFLDSNGNLLHKGLETAYWSQYGLQGKVFRHFARVMDEDDMLANLHLICSLLTALTFAAIVWLISRKYNNIFAGCFLVTFWLSPWIINFARNLYWVEFTWFIPMAIGLFCAWKISDKKCRIASYIMTFIAITGKCLCGYEYITVVMMGLIAFLLVDFVKALVEKNHEKSILVFRTIFIIGVIALCGFMAAICIHAPLKGDGNLIEGIKNIFEQDVLRRTAGADLNDFDPVYWDSFNASVWQTYCTYFHFSTEIITGITGNLFPLLCIIPLCIFGFEYKNKRLNTELVAMYCVFFLTSISWFVLAKSHSYVHTHMNYVLWYFGFVQICFYIIVNKIVSAIRLRGKLIKEQENE